MTAPASQPLLWQVGDNLMRCLSTWTRKAASFGMAIACSCVSMLKLLVCIAGDDEMISCLLQLGAGTRVELTLRNAHGALVRSSLPCSCTVPLTSAPPSMQRMCRKVSRPAGIASNK